MILPHDGSPVKRPTRARSIEHLRQVLAAARQIMQEAEVGSPRYHVGQTVRDQLVATISEIEEHGEPVSTFSYRLAS